MQFPVFFFPLKMSWNTGSCPCLLPGVTWSGSSLSFSQAVLIKPDDLPTHHKTKTLHNNLDAAQPQQMFDKTQHV